MTSKLVLHTDRIPEEKQREVEQLVNKVVPADVEIVNYNHHIEVSWRDINKYNACITLDEILEVNPDAGSDLTSDGEWVYPLDSMKYINSSNPANNPFRQASKIVKFAVPLPNATNMREAFLNNKSMKHLELYIPNAWDCASMLGGMDALEYLDLYAPNAELSIYLYGGKSVEYAKIYAAKTRNLNLNTPNLKKIDAVIPLINNMAYVRGQIDKGSALGILQQITEMPNPEKRGCLMGIHVDHKNDEEIMAEVSRLEEMGWPVTIQWNGTATAQASTTYGLRKPPIYAKVSEYERPDGTVERVLDWGHYVTDPSGYEEFISLEEAYEYFNLPMDE